MGKGARLRREKAARAGRMDSIPEAEELRKLSREFVSGAKPDVPDNTVDGKCSGCGSCCRALLMMHPAELALVKAYVAEHRIRPELHEAAIVRRQGIREGEGFSIADIMCPFLRDQERDRCAVYPARPAVCKAYSCRDMQPGGDTGGFAGRLEACLPEGASWQDLAGTRDWKKETNLRQEIFPDVFMPEPGDMCTVNERDRELFGRHGMEQAAVADILPGPDGTRMAMVVIAPGQGHGPVPVMTDIRNIDRLLVRRPGWKTSDLGTSMPEAWKAWS